jgi:aromatic ring-opening dioxygenase catalytic subunit (LigB family)
VQVDSPPPDFGEHRFFSARHLATMSAPTSASATTQAGSMAGGPRLPTFFIPHGGGPCFFMAWNPPGIWDRMADFLRGLADTLPQPPQAILLVTAHWLATDFTVSSGERPGMIFDYHGFPPHTYELSYPAPGEPALASRVQSLLSGAGLSTHADSARGFDHGTFIPLLLMFPQADVPVVQLSLRRDLDPQAHLDAGRALAPLRDEGVLIVGSGMSFHNMRGYGDPRFGPVSDAFDAWLTESVQAPPSARTQALAAWEQAPQARLCHPPRAEEHLLPLMVAAGAATDSPGHKVFSDRVMETTLSAFRFG